jgi:hypothetical protein
MIMVLIMCVTFFLASLLYDLDLDTCSLYYHVFGVLFSLFCFLFDFEDMP